MRERERKPQEANINLPYFHGKDNLETNLDWEIRVEQQLKRKFFYQAKHIIHRPIRTSPYPTRQCIYYWELKTTPLILSSQNLKHLFSSSVVACFDLPEDSIFLLGETCKPCGVLLGLMGLVQMSLGDGDEENRKKVMSGHVGEMKN